MPFPTSGSMRDKLRFALRAALLAPSGHNTQPWLFRLREDSVELYADRRRSLPVLDPQDREMTISCGAALFNIRVALEAHELAARVELLPNSEQKDLMARVQLTVPPRATTLGSLWSAIPRRHTHRLPFAPRAVEPDHIWALQEAACAEGCRFLALAGELRAEAVSLIGEVDVRVATDPLYRRGLRDWLAQHERGEGETVLEGVEVTMLDEFVSTLPRLLMRFQGNGRARAEHDRELALKAPLLALVAAPGDAPRHWLQVGQALQRVLLEGAARGLQASFLNQPLELMDTRNWMARWTSGSVPHLMLRFGYPESSLRSPSRRPLEELLLED